MATAHPIPFESGGGASIAKILIVDDKPVMLTFLRESLEKDGHTVFSAQDGEEAHAGFRENSPDVVITDMNMPRLSGLELLKRIKVEDPDALVIFMTGFATIESAIESMKEGAYDYIEKPFSMEKLRATLTKAIERATLVSEIRELRRQLVHRFRFENLLGQTGKMQEVFEMMSRVIETKTTVLILGETGTGKEMVARAIHFSGPRKDKPFIKVNCAAIPETLLESELFGHEKGAYTGAVQKREGRFELAHTGTLFLDEIGDLPLPLQAKLLRVLQFKEFERLGGNKTIQVDVRILTATGSDLSKQVEEGRFRKDLFYRLNVVPITVPPLRERGGDIPVLAEHFLANYAKDANKTITGFTPEAMRDLMRYAWPGNVRELENAVERAVVMAQRDQIHPNDLPPTLRSARDVSPFGIPEVGVHKLTEVVESIERAMIAEALKRTQSSQTRAAELLGVNRGTLIYKMKKFGFLASGGDGEGEVDPEAEPQGSGTQGSTTPGSTTPGSDGPEAKP